MEIAFEKFIEIVTAKALHNVGIHAISRGHKIAVQQYCNKLTVRGACTGECDTCALKLKDAAEWIIGKNPTNPYAMYTYLMKNAGGQRVDELAKKQPVAKPEANIFNEATERDAFDIFEDALNGR